MIPSSTDSAQDDDQRAARIRMVETQIRRRGVHDAAVLAAMRTVPRHRFVPEAIGADAYADRALPLGPMQTISQPFVVAKMTEAAADRGVRTSHRDRVLEIGTGSGYQAAVLAEIFGHVDTIELDRGLAAAAAERLRTLGYRNVRGHVGDGMKGLAEHAPYDAILITASIPEVPDALMQQLRIGGRIVYPRGPDGGDQTLCVAQRRSARVCEERPLMPVRFVPMRGRRADN